jgi:nicotinamidase/pyrazinamidase
MPMSFSENDVLVVVDVQNDFCTGSVAIPGYETIIPVINRLGAMFSQVVVTQDWHPEGHVSFFSAHPGARIGDTVKVHYGEQVVYAEHCVRDTWGAELHPELSLPATNVILHKGCRRDVDSFSAFVENDRRTTTGLADMLRARGAGRLYFTGLTLNGCVRHSALDARKAGFNASIVLDGARSRPGIDEKQLFATFAEAGVALVKSAELGA